jgi:hypothetical protein
MAELMERISTYEALREILERTPELISTSDINKLGLNDLEKSLVLYINDCNLKRDAPRVKQINKQINSSVSAIYGARVHLEKERIIVGPTFSDYVALLRTRKGHKIYVEGLYSVQNYIEDRNRGKEPKFYLGYFYEENRPVYANCFPSRNLKFVPRILSKVQIKI